MRTTRLRSARPCRGRHAVCADQERGQQAVLMLHKTRELLVKQRTMTVNALRGHLSEFGLIAPRASTGSRNCWRSRSPTRPFPKRPSKPRRCWLAQRRPRRKDRRFGEDDRPSKRQEPDKPVAGRDPLRPADRIGDRRSHSDPGSSGREAISARLWALRRASTRAAVRTSSAPSPKRATDICARCWSWDAVVLRVAHKHKGALAEWIVAMRARKPERVVAVALATSWPESRGR